MADGEVRLSALAAGYRIGDFGVAAATGPGVILRERRPLAIVQIASWPDQAATARVAASSVLGGIALPTAPNTSAVGASTVVLAIGPQRWLVVEPERPGHDLVAMLASACGGQAAITDIGHGRTVLRLSGPRAPALLAKGCSLDLHQSKFPLGACAQGLLAQFGVLIHAVDATPGFDLYVSRSYALALWEWLGESAAEYGYRVEAPLTI